MADQTLLKLMRRFVISSLIAMQFYVLPYRTTALCFMTHTYCTLIPAFTFGTGRYAFPMALLEGL